MIIAHFIPSKKFQIILHLMPISALFKNVMDNEISRSGLLFSFFTLYLYVTETALMTVVANK